MFYVGEFGLPPDALWTHITPIGLETMLGPSWTFQTALIYLIVFRTGARAQARSRSHASQPGAVPFSLSWPELMGGTHLSSTGHQYTESPSNVKSALWLPVVPMGTRRPVGHRGSADSYLKVRP